MKKRDGFKRGGGGVYACKVCGRLTRLVPDLPWGSELCYDCYEIAGLENEYADNIGPNEDESPEALRIIAAMASWASSAKEKGGDLEGILDGIGWCGADVSRVRAMVEGGE